MNARNTAYTIQRQLDSRRAVLRWQEDQPMTVKEIESMEAGRDMDALIVKAVFGLELQECMVGGHPPGCTGNVQYPHYSTDIADAWKVVEKLKEAGFGFWIAGDECWFQTAFAAIKRTSATSISMPLAVCRAALMAVSQEGK